MPPIRVVVDEPTGWSAFLFTNPAETVTDVLKAEADRSSLDRPGTSKPESAHQRRARSHIDQSVSIRLCPHHERY
jgi:hypothetical protein